MWASVSSRVHNCATDNRQLITTCTSANLSEFLQSVYYLAYSNAQQYNQHKYANSFTNNFFWFSNSWDISDAILDLLFENQTIWCQPLFHHLNTQNVQFFWRPTLLDILVWYQMVKSVQNIPKIGSFCSFNVRTIFLHLTTRPDQSSIQILTVFLTSFAKTTFGKKSKYLYRL